MMFRNLFVAFAFILCSCAEKPGSSGPPESFVRLHADLSVLREEARLRGLDSLTLGRQTDSVLQAEAVSRETYEATLRDLRSDLPRWKAFNDRVAKWLDSLQRQNQPPDTGRARLDQLGRSRPK